MERVGSAGSDGSLQGFRHKQQPSHPFDSHPSPPLLLISAPACEPGPGGPIHPILEPTRPRAIASVRHQGCNARQTSKSQDLLSHQVDSGGSSRASYRRPFRSKRPPASRCSNGVETAYGPPPTSITRASSYGDSGRNYVNLPDRDIAGVSSQLELSRSGGKSCTRTRASSIAQSEGGNSGTSTRGAVTEQSRPEGGGTMAAEDARSPHSPPDADDIYYDAEQVNGNDSSSNFENKGDDASVAHRRIKSGPARQEDIMQSTNEDLFLNLAQDGTPQQNRERASSRSEKRQSRVDVTKYRKSLPIYTSSVQDSDTSQDIRSQIAERYQDGPQARTNLNEARPKTSDSSRYGDHTSRLFGFSSRSTASTTPNEASSEIPYYGRRRPSITNSIQSSNQRHPQYRFSRLGRSPVNDPEKLSLTTSPTGAPQNGAKPSLPDGTDSVNSNTAPSTVWDELDELKSRIKKLELTGKLPATSGQAVSNGSGERPRTATTTVTTISSSPKHRKTEVSEAAGSQEDSEQNAGVHPLLHSALARAKQVLAPSTYRVLEATASDALALATMTGNTGSQGASFSAASTINGTTGLDRNIRRKADNMCRSLTELCIALCESKTITSPTNSTSTMVSRPVSRDTPTNAGAPSIDSRISRERQGSLEPEREAPPRNSPSRALTRIEARRTSLNTTTFSAANSPRETTTPRSSTFHTPPSQQSSSQIPSRLTRTGVSLLRERRRIANHESTDDEASLPDEPTLRAPSRAMTDIGHASPAAAPQSNIHRFRNRVSREYTSSHPLPTTQSPPSQRLPSSPLTPSSTSTLAQSLAARRGSGVGAGVGATQGSSSPLEAGAARKSGGGLDLPLRGSGRRYGDNNGGIGNANSSPLSATMPRYQRLSGQFAQSPLAGGKGTDKTAVGRTRSLGRGARGGSVPVE